MVVLDPSERTAHDRLFAEILVVFQRGGRVHRVAPVPDAWQVEVCDGEDPMEIVRAAVNEHVGPPVLVHSTSWRTESDRVLLTFIVVVDDATVDDATVGTGAGVTPVTRAEVVRGGPTDPPGVIAVDAVLEHALRHLAWLLDGDPVVAGALGDEWRAALAEYVPEPFAELDRIDNPLDGIDSEVRLSCRCGFEASGRPADIVATIAAHALEAHRDESE